MSKGFLGKFKMHQRNLAAAKYAVKDNNGAGANLVACAEINIVPSSSSSSAGRLETPFEDEDESEDEDDSEASDAFISEPVALLAENETGANGRREGLTLFPGNLRYA